MSLLTNDPGTFVQAPQQQETNFRSVKTSESIIQIFSEIRFCCFDAVNDNDDINDDNNDNNDNDNDDYDYAPVLLIVSDWYIASCSAEDFW